MIGQNLKSNCNHAITFKLIVYFVAEKCKSLATKNCRYSMNFTEKDVNEKSRNCEHDGISRHFLAITNFFDTTWIHL